MQYLDLETEIKTTKELTNIKQLLENLVKESGVSNGTLNCWVPHEVASIVQIEDDPNLKEDFLNFVTDIIPEKKWIKHDEPGTSFRFNAFNHFRTKLLGHFQIELIIRDKELVIGKYQGFFIYNPVFKDKLVIKLICRIIDLD